MIQEVHQQLVEKRKCAMLNFVVEDRPRQRVVVVDRTERLQDLLVGAVAKLQVALSATMIASACSMRIGLVAAEPGQALRVEFPQDVLRAFAAENRSDRVGDVVVADQRDDHVGILATGNRREVEMLNAAADIADDSCSLYRRCGRAWPRLSMKTRTGPSKRRMRSVRCDRFATRHSGRL